ncbi:hypothetical protein HZA57_08420 [Candidatus Poribacteria bacterium]|nr:hypothetical protein [Candidatus Poribacteria bacterium]
MNSMERKLLARLIKAGALNDFQAEELRVAIGDRAAHLVPFLVEKRLVDQKTLARHIARLNGLEFLDLDSFEPDEAVLRLLPARIARRARAVPVGLIEDSLVIAVADPTNIHASDEVRAATGKAVQSVLTGENALEAALQRYYAPGQTEPDAEETIPTMQMPGLHEAETRLDTESAVQLPAAPRKPDAAAPQTSPSSMETVELPAPTTEELTPEQGISSRSTVHESRGEAPGLRPLEFEEFPTHHDLHPVKVEEHRSPTEDHLEVVSFSGGGATTAAEPDIVVLLRHMIDDAIAMRAEELEYSPPSAQQTRARVRRAGLWEDLESYPVRLHEPLIARLRALAGAFPREPKPVECHFVVTGKGGNIPVVALFTPTLRGDRCVLRFPENVPLIQRPLRLLGLPKPLLDEFERRLAGAGGGLLALSSENSRLSAQLYASVLHQHATEGRSVISLESDLDRVLPNISQLKCPDEETLLEGLRHVALESPDLCGIATIPTSRSLAEIIGLCLKGRPVITCATIANAQLALASYDAGGVDRMTRTLGIIAHVHVSQVPRLCPECRRHMEPIPVERPDWLSDVPAGNLFEAPGCERCNNSGRKGTNWVPEIFTPDPLGSGRFLSIRTREASLGRLAAGGWFDYRDALDKPEEEAAGGEI